MQLASTTLAGLPAQ